MTGNCANRSKRVSIAASALAPRRRSVRAKRSSRARTTSVSMSSPVAAASSRAARPPQGHRISRLMILPRLKRVGNIHRLRSLSNESPRAAAGPGGPNRLGGPQRHDRRLQSGIEQAVTDSPIVLTMGRPRPPRPAGLLRRCSRSAAPCPPRPRPSGASSRRRRRRGSPRGGGRWSTLGNSRLAHTVDMRSISAIRGFSSLGAPERRREMV